MSLCTQLIVDLVPTASENVRYRPPCYTPPHKSRLEERLKSFVTGSKYELSLVIKEFSF